MMVPRAVLMTIVCGLHPAERGRVDQVVGGLAGGHVQGDDVGAGDQLVEGDRAQTERALLIGRQPHDRVVVDARGAEGLEPRRRLAADAAHADIAHRSAEELEGIGPQAVDVPAPLAQLAVGEGQPFAHGECEHHGVLGDADRGAGRGQRERDVRALSAATSTVSW